MPTLTIQLPGLPPVSHLLKDETITIGRMKGNTIVVEDASISLMHAKITRKDGQFYLKDLNSTNGTSVNGQPVSEAKLRPLDKVKFADITGLFDLEEIAPASVPAPAPALSAAPVSPAPIPAPATNAAPASFAPAPAFKPARPPTRKFSLAQSFGAAVPYIGGLAAASVIGFFGWRFLHVNAEPSHKTTEATQPAPSSIQKPQPTRVAKLSSPPQRAEAVRPAPTTVPSEPAVEGAAQLAKVLHDGDPAERRRAATALHSLGPEVGEATLALREALKDADSEVRIWSALTLINEKIYDKAAIPILVQGLHHDNPVLRQVACLSLGLIPYEGEEKDTVIPALAEAAGKDGDGNVREAALSALNLIAPEVVGKAAEK